MAIEDAQHDSTDAQIEIIKMQASAEVITAHEEFAYMDSESVKAEAQVDEANRKHAGSEEEAKRTSNNTGTAHGEVATEIASELFLGSSTKIAQMGLKMFQDMDPGAGTDMKTFESDKKAMLRKPGLYKNSDSLTDLNQSDAGKAWKGLTGKDLFGDINAAGNSITKNTKKMAQTAQVNATTITSQTRVVRDLTLSKEMACQLKYDNAVSIQMNRGGPQGPGLCGGTAHQNQSYDLAMAPRGPSKSMLTEEETTGAMA